MTFQVFSNITLSYRQYFNSVLLVFLAFAVNGCAALRVPDTGESRQIIATHNFVANRNVNFGYKLSPDGNKLAWFAVNGKSLDIFIKDLSSNLEFSQNSYGLRYFDWSFDGQNLISDSLTESGTENNVIITFAADYKRRYDAPNVISAIGGVKSVILGQSKSKPNTILVINNKRNKALFDLFSVDLTTKQHTLVQENPGNIHSWILSSDGDLAGRVIQRQGNFILQTINSDNHDFADTYQWTADDTVKVISVDKSLQRSILLSNKDGNFIRLIALDHQTGTVHILHEHPGVDISEVYIRSDNGNPLIINSEPDFPASLVLDEALRKLIAQIPGKSPARLKIESSDATLNKFVVSLQTDRDTEFYLVDLKNSSAVLIAPSANSNFSHALSPTLPIQFPSRDKHILHGYLTLPGNTPSPVPLVLKVHGGPWERDVWKYDAESQFLANRGYAVLQVNFRGSVGYGRQFQSLGYGEWGGAMQNDLIDAVDWAISQGITSKNRVGIMGSSYGGYAALMGVSTAPEQFSCGVAFNAPSNLIALVNNIPEQFRGSAELVKKYIGDPHVASQRSLLEKRSPLTWAPNLRAPFLLAQGQDDIRVNQQQAVEFANAVNKDNSQFELWMLPNTGHSVGNWKVSLQFFRKVESFFAKCLGGTDNGFDYYQIGTYLF